MAAFLSNQLDFIFFFYGLAFILLGVTCWAVARSRGGGEAWALLAGFGFVHGVGEWLDLAALIIGDTPAFAIARTALMTASFMLLMDFARVQGIRLGLKLPGRWIYVLLALAVALAGVTQGLTAAGIVSRYAIGLVGAAGASAVVAWQARSSVAGTKAFARSASAGFALYAIAAGLVVPAGHFFPSNIINYGTFAELTGMPIQLVRGLLACWISFSAWAIWSQRRAADVGSTHYSAYVRQQFIWTLVAMGSILLSGWTLTEYLGDIYRQNVQKEANSDIDLLASRLTADTGTIEGMAKALAGSLALLPGGIEEGRIAQSVLDLDVEASGAKSGYIVDRSGIVVASSNHREALPGTAAFNTAPHFLKSIAGTPDYRFVFDPRLGVRDYYASYPVRDGEGRIIGVAVLIKSLDSFEADLRQFDRPYFFIDPDGVIVMTNRADALHRTLWPLPAGKRSALAGRFPSLNDHPMLERSVADGTWTNVDGERNYIRRGFANHSDWSLVILKPSREIFATRFLGIVITLLVTLMALIYLLGKGRWIHDDIQMDKRAKLQELASDLGVMATTDPLTGLYNRHKLEPLIAAEMQRTDRYHTPMSLVLFDVDHFKKVNDGYGHQMGDEVLVRLARLVPNLLRSGDLLARWGGEEFLILIPGCDGPMAFQAAEKLREAIANMMFDDLGSVTCSFGVAEHVPGETGTELIARADAALYLGKSSGRNQVRLAPLTGPGKGGARSAT